MKTMYRKIIIGLGLIAIMWIVIQFFFELQSAFLTVFSEWVTGIIIGIMVFVYFMEFYSFAEKKLKK